MQTVAYNCPPSKTKTLPPLILKWLFWPKQQLLSPCFLVPRLFQTIYPIQKVKTEVYNTTQTSVISYDLTSFLHCIPAMSLSWPDNSTISKSCDTVKRIVTLSLQNEESILRPPHKVKIINAWICKDSNSAWIKNSLIYLHSCHLGQGGWVRISAKNSEETNH